MSRVMLFGGAGFLGRNLQEAFASHGHQVTVVDRDKRASGDGQHCIDLLDQAAIADLMQARHIDTLVHLACGLLPSSTAQDFAREQREIIEPSFRLMEHCARVGTRLVLVSSGGTVYGDCLGQRVREDHHLAPKSYYGFSKVMLEAYAQLCHRLHGLQYLLLRPSNPYGRHQRLQGAQGLIAVSLGSLLKQQPLQVWGDGSAVRDYLEVRDLAFGVVSLVASGIANQTFNIGSGVGHSLNDVLAMVGEITGRQVQVNYLARREADVNSIVLDTLALEVAITWQPRPLRLGLEEFCQSLGLLNGR